MKTIEELTDTLRAAKRRNRPVDDVSPGTTDAILAALRELAMARAVRDSGRVVAMEAE